ncbi:MAG: uncharacterized protein PWQ93_164 [Clostridiales bacterium]|nr:uncharacterized protein [Clostridiales bacterium]
MDEVKRPKRKKKNQVPAGIVLLIIVVAVGIVLAGISPMLSIYWIFGISFGFVLQKSRFCFTASLRDPVLTGSTSLTRAVIVALMLATIGFAAVQYSAVSKELPVPGNIAPAGIFTAIGATMFGIGMVIAGGCASGTLMRVGEGFVQQCIALLFFIFGSMWGAHDYGWWADTFFSKAPTIFLPDLLGWAPALFGQLIVLAILFLIAEWYENKKLGSEEE